MSEDLIWESGLPHDRLHFNLDILNPFYVVSSQSAFWDKEKYR